MGWFLVLHDVWGGCLGVSREGDGGREEGTQMAIAVSGWEWGAIIPPLFMSHTPKTSSRGRSRSEIKELMRMPLFFYPPVTQTVSFLISAFPPPPPSYPPFLPLHSDMGPSVHVLPPGVGRGPRCGDGAAVLERLPHILLAKRLCEGTDCVTILTYLPT